MHPNVIFVSFDALRKDFLKTYNNSVSHVTVFERAAEKGVVFHNAFPNGNWTVPSHASMFSGLEPYDHEVYNWNESLKLNTTTIFSLARDLGYKTVCYASNGVTPIIGNEKGLFDYIAHTWDSYIDSIKQSVKPWFVFLHFLETHAPYGIDSKYTPEPNDLDFVLENNKFNYIRKLICSDQISLVEKAYRKQLQKASDVVNKLWNQLGENTVVILCSDHGEDWRPYHPFHCSFEEAVLRIPLVACSPAYNPAVNFNLIAHSDMLSLLCILAGWPQDLCSKKTEAGDLKKWMPDSAQKGRIIICGPNSFDNNEVYFAVRDLNHMAILQPSKRSYQVYEIGQDGHRRSLHSESVDSIFLETLEQVAQKCEGKRPYVEPSENPEEIIKHLKQLGYI